jgi:hypothetical protein
MKSTVCSTGSVAVALVKFILVCWSRREWRTLTDDSPATDMNTDEEVAIKLKRVSVDPSLLREEVEGYKSLAGGAGIPTVY